MNIIPKECEINVMHKVGILSEFFSYSDRLLGLLSETNEEHCQVNITQWNWNVSNILHVLIAKRMINFGWKVMSQVSY